MAVKAVVSKIEDVPETLRGEYEQGEGGAFYLKVEGLEDGSAHPAVGALVRAKKREADRASKLEAAVKEHQTALAAKTDEYESALKGVVPKGNLEALEKSYQEKLVKVASEKDTEIGSLNSALNEVLIDNVATALAGSLANSPEQTPLFIPFIRSRLAVERKDGKASTRVLDADGKPSAATLDDLKKEIAGNKTFSAILRGSSATGGGATGGSAGGGATPRAAKVDWTPGKASLADKVANLRAIEEQLGGR